MRGFLDRAANRLQARLADTTVCAQRVSVRHGVTSRTTCNFMTGHPASGFGISLPCDSEDEILWWNLTTARWPCMCAQSRGRPRRWGWTPTADAQCISDIELNDGPIRWRSPTTGRLVGAVDRHERIEARARAEAWSEVF